MAYMSTLEKDIQSIELTNVNYVGTREPDTIYKVGDYVYVNKKSKYYYKAIKSGKTKSNTHGTSSNYPINWFTDGVITDNNLRWLAVEVTDTEQYTDWKENTLYKLGTVVKVPGNSERSKQYVYRLVQIVHIPDWPNLPNETIVDGTVEWKSCLSYLSLLPSERQKETIYIELCRIMDYLSQNEAIYVKDVEDKFNDRVNIRNESILQLIDEFGYTYISDMLNLTEDELTHLVTYLGIIQSLKGSKSGLEIVLELFGVSFKSQEWWEEKDEKGNKGTPDTWNLAIELDTAKAVSGLINRIITFTRNYVYPVLKEFSVTYRIDLAKLNIFMGGFIDKEYSTSVEPDLTMFMLMGFIDRELTMIIDRYTSIDIPSGWYADVVVGGFMDRDYEMYAEDSLVHAGLGGFVDRELPFIVDRYSEQEEIGKFDSVKTMLGGFIDKEVSLETYRDVFTSCLGGFVDRELPFIVDRYKLTEVIGSVEIKSCMGGFIDKEVSLETYRDVFTSCLGGFVDKEINVAVDRYKLTEVIGNLEIKSCMGGFIDREICFYTDTDTSISSSAMYGFIDRELDVSAKQINPPVIPKIVMSTYNINSIDPIPLLQNTLIIESRLGSKSIISTNNPYNMNLQDLAEFGLVITTNEEKVDFRKNVVSTDSVQKVDIENLRDNGIVIVTKIGDSSSKMVVSANDIQKVDIKALKENGLVIVTEVIIAGKKVVIRADDISTVDVNSLVDGGLIIFTDSKDKGINLVLSTDDINNIDMNMLTNYGLVIFTENKGTEIIVNTKDLSNVDLKSLKEYGLVIYDAVTKMNRRYKVKN